MCEISNYLILDLMVFMVSDGVYGVLASRLSEVDTFLRWTGQGVILLFEGAIMLFEGAIMLYEGCSPKIVTGVLHSHYTCPRTFHLHTL